MGQKVSKVTRRYFHLPDDTAQRQLSRLRLSGEARGTVAAGNTTQEAPEVPKQKTRRK